MGPLLFVMAAIAGAPPDLEAVGIILSRRNEACIAILRSGGRQRIVGVGRALRRDGLLDRARPRLLTSPESASRCAWPAWPRRRRLSRPPPPRRPRPTTPTPASMERREMERRLGQEVPRILAETTLVPVTESGQMAGFTLTRLPEGTLLTDAGLRPGDVLTSINDIPIDSLATLVGLWPRLQTASDIRAMVLRNGQPVSLSVHLR
jgi:type II secretory pathway component PulC